ncbi:MAG: tRNA 2-thiouridine(34) synthase MnmA, partial [Bacteroidota bacterium]|nr:tRNA 2-thiouridine(34) synthase MnmA [Bacteroidota bacterium]MDX5430573.1 tRNA 2-thiouridine(34) synthase MnmA [Bacteroidota bacterium]MDX5469325.1 tRNA 2-thiouridine(34) synthase MnmA [Bacteroidota bacterium]
VDMGYIDLAKKSESYEICFVPDNDYRQFLRNRVEGLEERVNGGNFVTADGTVLGQHKGYPFYTIGQRKGLEIALGEPMYVTEIRPDSNTVVLGKKEELERNGMWVRTLNLQKYDAIPEGIETLTKIRYKDAGAMAQLHQEGDRVEVKFNTRVNAIAPGQSAVFYEGEDVIGGGWIQSSFEV